MQRGTSGRTDLVIGACACVVAAALVLTVGIEALGVLAAFLVLAAIAWRWPQFGAGVLLLMSVDFFGLVPVAALPSLKIAGGITVNLLDATLATLLALAVVRLASRREVPEFTWPTVLIVCASVLCVIWGMLFATIGLGVALGAVRYMFYYSSYFVLVAAIDSEESLRRWIRFLFVLVLVTVSLQVYEAVMGGLSPIVSQAGVVARPLEVAVGGESHVAYVWNRAPFFAFIGTFLALGAFVVKARGRRWIGAVAVAGTLGFALALVRQWYVYYAIGAVSLLVIARRVRNRGVVALALVALVVVVGVSAVPLFTNSFGRSLGRDVVLRAATLTSGFENDNSYVARVQGAAVSPDCRFVWLGSCSPAATWVSATLSPSSDWLVSCLWSRSVSLCSAA